MYLKGLDYKLELSIDVKGLDELKAVNNKKRIALQTPVQVLGQENATITTKMLHDWCIGSLLLVLPKGRIVKIHYSLLFKARKVVL